MLKSIIQNFLSTGHTRTVNAKRNILIMLVIRSSSIALSFFLVPLTIHYVNPARYGIWLTLSAIIGWFGFFDIGFGNGLRNRLTEAITRGENDLARIYISTTYFILSIIISIVLLAFFCINHFLVWPKILNTPMDMAAELSSVALMIFVFFSLQFVLRLINTVLTANQQPAKASLFEFIGSLFSFILIYILTKTTEGNLLYLGAAFSITPVFVFFLSSIWYYSTEYRKFAPNFKYVRLSYSKDLMSLGLKFFIIQIAAVVLYETSNLIIAQLFGPEQVTSYNIAFKYFSVIPMGLGIIMFPFWSAFTEAWVKRDLLWINNTVYKLKLLILCVSGVAIIMFLLSKLVYKVWVGQEIKVSIGISAAMAFYVIINGWSGIFSHFLNGVGKIKMQLYYAVIGAVLNIPLAIVLGKWLGITGVILATCLIAIPSAIISPIQYKKIINNKAKGIWNS
jgi:O-antigen/teichoic acid export membrane protein